MDVQFIRDRITQLRIRRNISEHKMSCDLGKGHSYIQRISSGHALPSLPMLLEICDYFCVTPEEFFHEDANGALPPLPKDFPAEFYLLSKENREHIRQIIHYLH